MLLKRMLFEGRFTRPNLICGSSHPGEFIVPSTRRPAAKTGLLEERRLEIVVRRRGIKREKDSDSIAKARSRRTYISKKPLFANLIVCAFDRTSDRIGNLKRDAQQQIVKTAPPVV